MMPPPREPGPPSGYAPPGATAGQSEPRGHNEERPFVSIIVPARDEEASLGPCLQSLLAQTGVTYEIVVVDDHSTDRTRTIAESFPGVCVLQARPLPCGWFGKANACQTGANAARGDWLLFTDADTVHKPGSLARALAEARQYGAALLSYSPEQEVHGCVQRALMPLVFAELARTFPPKEVSDPNLPVAAANGQYLLIARTAYDAVGGHAAVAEDLLEDVALATAVKRSGHKLFFRFGGGAVRTHMYRTWPQVREGWTKNFALLFPSSRRLARNRMLEFLVMAGGLAVAAVGATLGKRNLAVVAALLATATWLNLFRRVRKAHFDWFSTMLAPLGLPLFAYLLRRSRICHGKGTVVWKGREYSGALRRDSGVPATRETKIPGTAKFR